jgi:hypothetical protein
MLIVGHLYKLKYPINVGYGEYSKNRLLTDTIYFGPIMTLVNIEHNAAIFLMRDTLLWTYAGGDCFEEINEKLSSY